MIHAIQTSTKTQIILAVHSHTHGEYIYIYNFTKNVLIKPLENKNSFMNKFHIQKLKLRFTK